MSAGESPANGCCGLTDLTVLIGAAGVEDRWVRGFLLRLGYHLAAEFHDMPECELKDIVGNASAELVDMAEAMQPIPEGPHLRVVD